MRKAERAYLAGAFPRGFLPADAHASALKSAHTRYGLQKLTLPVALNGGDAEYLPGPDGKRNSVDGDKPAVSAHDKIIRAYKLLAGRAGLFKAFIKHRPAHHHGRKAALRHVGGVFHADEPPLAHHTHSVRYRHDLIQLVRYYNDGHAVLLHDLANDLKKLFRFLRREHRRRLVQYQDVSAAVQRFQNLHALLKADAHFPDNCRGIHQQAVFFRKLSCRGLRRPVVKQDAQLLRLTAEHDILRRRERRHEHEVLVHHADAKLYRPSGAELVQLSAAYEHLPVRRLVYAVENVHQRGFPRAVLPDERKHLTAPYVQRYVVICENAGKFHAHMPELYCKLFHRYPSFKQGGVA